MRYVDASRADQKRFTPRIAKCRNIGRERYEGALKPVQGTQMYGRNQQNLLRLRVRPHRTFNLVPKFRGISNNTDHDFGTGFVRDNVRRAPASDGSYVKRACAKKIICWEVDPPDAFKCIKKLFNGRLTK